LTHGLARREDTRVHSTPTGVDALIKDGVPDWGVIDFDVLCARCGYNLRMLTTPRCPECGLDFEWRIVLDQAATQSDFLFEHNWRSRPVRSWLTTVWRGLRPKRFWQSVSIHERVRAGPLWLMMASAVPAFLLAYQGLAGLLSLPFGWFGNWVARQAPPSSPVGPAFAYQANTLQSLAGGFETLAWQPIEAGPAFISVPLSIAVTLAATLAFLCGLRQTLGRSGVRTVQLLRVVTYASVPGAIMVAVATIVAMVLVNVFIGGTRATALVMHASQFFLLLGVPAYYLAVPLRRYLHLPRPWTLAATACFVGLLTTTTILFATLALTK
jgi:hypothetical protein